jgi:hypothetical protein
MTPREKDWEIAEVLRLGKVVCECRWRFREAGLQSNPQLHCRCYDFSHRVLKFPNREMNYCCILRSLRSIEFFHHAHILHTSSALAFFTPLDLVIKGAAADA